MSCCDDAIILGKVGRALKFITVQAAGLQTSAYADGTVLCDLLEFPCAVQEASGTALVLEAILYEKATGSAVKPTIDLILFSASQTLASVGAAYVGPSTVTEILGVVSFTTGGYKEVSAGRAINAQKNVQINLQSGSNSKTIYGALVAKGAFTLPTGTEIHCQVRIAQD